MRNVMIVNQAFRIPGETGVRQLLGRIVPVGI